MNNPNRRSRLALAMIIASVLLAMMFGLSVSSALIKSPTFDEGLYIARGWVYLRTGRLLSLGHPPLTNELVGLGVLLEPDLPDPATLNGWDTGTAEWIGEDLLWNHNLNTNRIVFLARIPIIFLGILLGAVVWRWGREMYGLWSATVALALVSFSPTVISNMQLATTDLGVAFFYIAALYTWARFLKRRTLRWLIFSGFAFGLAQASKFSALILIPTLGLMTLWVAWRYGPFTFRSQGRFERLFNRLGAGRLGWLWTGLCAPVLMGVVGLVVLWACQAFAVRPLEPGYYSGELKHFFSLAEEGHRAYLLGRFSQNGWWYYHPFTMLVKLTLPELLLIASAVVAMAVRGVKKTEWYLIFPALFYLCVSMVGSLNVGIRYLLPVIPLLFILASRRVTTPMRFQWLPYAASGVLVIGQMVASTIIYPDYLSFFNVAAGGPDRGSQLLVDSNLDWGQDLPSLAKYIRDNKIEQVYLSYFGHADPAYYGINYIPLPGWPPPDLSQHAFYPMNPDPGVYAISASNLVGLLLFEQDTFGYFLTKEPVARIGHSIFIYEVLGGGEGSSPTWIGQCAAPEPSEDPRILRNRSGIVDLNHFYFDCLRSLPVQPGKGWLLFPPEATPLVEIGDPDYLVRWKDGTLRYRIWQVSGAPPAPPSSVDFPSVTLPIPIADHLMLLGYEVTPTEVAAGQTVTLTAWWRVRELPPLQVSIFAHLTKPDGTLLQAGDSLGIRAEDWQTGMILIQQHSFYIGEDTPPGDYSLSVGLYSFTTGERFPIAETTERVVDHIILRMVRVVSGVR